MSDSTPNRAWPELVNDSGPAELGERVLGRTGCYDGTVGQRLARPVMVGDDHVEPSFLGLGHLVDGRDPAVDGEDEPAALVGEPGERLAADAVALVEATREMPGDVGAELAQEKDGEGGGGDAVHVVVAVDADPSPLRDGCSDLGTCGLHVPEQEGVVRRLLAVEEAASVGRVGVPTPDEHGGRHIGDPELPNELCLGGRRAVGECPGTFVHVQPSYGDGRTESARGPGRTRHARTGSRNEATTRSSPVKRHASLVPRGGWGFGMD